MLCSTATYPSGTHAPPPSTTAESIYTMNGANANKGLFCFINLSIINVHSFRLLDTSDNI